MPRDSGSDAVILRPAQNADADGLIALIGGCFAEYPGCVMDVDGELPELRAIADHFARRGGRFWVGEAADDAIVACGGVAPTDNPRVAELLKLYVRADHRGRGLAGQLIDLIAQAAVRMGAWHLILWTDTRFTTAHRVYERRGFARQAETRALNDKSDTVEFHYARSLPSNG